MLTKLEPRSGDPYLSSMKGFRTTLVRALLPFSPKSPVEAEPPPPSGPAPLPMVPFMGTVGCEEILLLEELVRESGQFEGPIVEIGTLLGVSTTQMALWKNPGQRIITVDAFKWNPWGLTADQHRALTTQMLYYLSRTGHVDLVVMDKDDFYDRYSGGPPSLVFLDAWHTYEETAKDIAWAKRAQARIICGHDYTNEFPGVIQAVDEQGGPRKLQGTLWCL